MDEKELQKNAEQKKAEKDRIYAEGKILFLLKKLIVDRRITSLGKLRRHHRDFLETIDADMKKLFNAGFTHGGSPRAIKKHAAEILDRLAVEANTFASGPGVRGTLVSQVAALDAFHLPAALRFKDTVIACGEPGSAHCADEAPGLERFIGETGVLSIGGTDAWNIRLERDRIGRYWYELLGQAAEYDAYQALLDHRITVSAECGRKMVPVTGLHALQEGALVEFFMGDYNGLDIYIEEYAVKIGKGDAVLADDVPGIKITACGFHPGLLVRQAEENIPPSCEPSVLLRLIFGKSEMTVRDLLCLDAGSVLPFRRKAWEPCEIIAGELSIPCEIVFMDDSLNAMIVPADGGLSRLLSPGKGAGKASHASVQSCEAGNTLVCGKAPACRQALDKQTGTITRLQDDIDEMRTGMLDLSARLETLRVEPVETPGGSESGGLEGLRRKTMRFIESHTAELVMYIRSLLSGEIRDAARLLAAIGPDVGAWIMKNLREDEIQRLALEIAKLDKVEQGEAEQAMRELHDFIAAGNFPVPAGEECAREMLGRALGSQKTIDLMNRIRSSIGGEQKPFDFVGQFAPEVIMNYIKDEYPQTIALVLVWLPPDTAAAVMGGFPGKLQAEVAARIAVMKDVSPNVMREVERVLERKLSTLSPTDPRRTRHAGLGVLSPILERVDAEMRKRIIEATREKDPALAKQMEEK